MKTYTVIERQQTSIPIADVLAADGSLVIFPEVREKGYFDLDFRRGELVVVSGKYIGHIPLNGEVLVDVRPKVGVLRLGQILEKAHEPLRCLDFYRRAYKSDEVSTDSIFEVLVRALVVTVRRIIVDGFLKEYIGVEKNLRTIRGRVKALHTVTRMHSRGLFTQANCSYFEFSADNALNRLIKYALWYSGNHLVARGSRNTELRKQISDLYGHFECVPFDLSMEFIGEARNYLENHRLPSIRSYYLEACDAALAVVSDSGLDLLGEGRNIHLASFLVDMETVFEHYIRNVLKEARPVANSELSVLDGNNEGKGWFFSDNKGHEAKPDLVLRSGKTVPMIGDVKYKAKLSEHDRYQVIAHALSFGAQIACIVMPTVQGETSGLERLGKVGTDRNVELFLYRINLETQNLGSEEEKMQDAICSLCASQVVPT